MAKKGNPAPANETERQKFVRLGEQRMNKAISALRGVRKLANKSSYDYTDAHATVMIETLTNEVKALAADFKAGKVSGTSGFKLGQ